MPLCCVSQKGQSACCDVTSQMMCNIIECVNLQAAADGFVFYTVQCKLFTLTPFSTAFLV